MIDVIAIENTTLCGGDCIMCPREKFTYHNETMTMDLFKKAVDQSASCGVSFINLTGFGDSLLDKNFENEVKYIRDNYSNIKIGLTNTCQMIEGHMLDVICEYIDELQISMYGITPATYHAIHRGSLQFEKVKKNIDDLLNRVDRPFCILEFLEMEENKAEMDDWLAYYESRADRVDIWKLQNWGDYLENTGENKPFKECFRINSLNGLYIRTDGSVSMCCVDYNRKMIIGNILDTPLKDIIEGKQVENLQRMNHDGSIASYGFCKDCDQIYDRSDALIYSSDDKMKVGEHTMLAGEDVYKGDQL